MNKFGLLEEKPKVSSKPSPKASSKASSKRSPKASLTDRLASFPAVRARAAPNLAAIDAAAAEHGFVSREVPMKAAAGPGKSRARVRRRKAVAEEPTRHLAIRLPSSAYDRFVAYADTRTLTYHEALLELLAMVET